MSYGNIFTNTFSIKEDTKTVDYKGIARNLHYDKKYDWIKGEVELKKTTFEKKERSKLGKLFMREDYYWDSRVDWHLTGHPEWRFDPLMIGRNNPREVIFVRHKKTCTDYYLDEEEDWSLYNFAKEKNEVYARQCLYKNEKDLAILPPKDTLIKIFAQIDDMILKEYDSIVSVQY